MLTYQWISTACIVHNWSYYHPSVQTDILASQRFQGMNYKAGNNNLEWMWRIADYFCKAVTVFLEWNIIMSWKFSNLSTNHFSLMFWIVQTHVHTYSMSATCPRLQASTQFLGWSSVNFEKLHSPWVFFFKLLINFF